MTDKKNVHKTPAAQSDDDSRQSRTFLAIALVMSIAAHVLLAWLGSGKPESRDITRSNIRHISLVTLPPKEVREAPTPTNSFATPSDWSRADRRLPGGKTGTSGLKFPTLPSSESGSQKLLDRVSGLGTTAPTDASTVNGAKVDPNADLASAARQAAKTYSRPDFNQDGASPPRNEKISANERAEQGMLAMKTEAAEQQQTTKNRRAPPTLAALETQSKRRFEPSSDGVAASVKKCKTCQHEVGHLVSLVDVTLSDGEAPAFRVAQSSGDPVFDAAALDALKAALPENAIGFAWSRFRFSAEVYHFSTTEMLLDPSFKPPGRRLASKDSGARSMTTSVRLVDFH
ncbi:MAG: hypothetical protein H7Z43_08620 [Clostridia bacterium]|nr:hypothetical protein [Deltaproteobacteria bacterium]